MTKLFSWLNEDHCGLQRGDRVQITGRTSFEFETGVVRGFSPDQTHVQVQLDGHDGSHMFNTSDVSLLEESTAPNIKTLKKLSGI